MGAGTQLERVAVPMAPVRARLEGAWKRSRERWLEIEPRQRQWAVGVGAMVLALLALLVWQATRTEWRLLMNGLDPEDARTLTAALTAEKIPYELGENGTSVLVPAAELDKARLATVTKGALKSGRLGFEIFDKPNWVGSEFDEQVNYQRALEGELEHTVASIADVESARVHLVMPHDSLFRDQERPAKASVVLKLRHRDLEEGEPDAIRRLVASAVDGLTPDRVVLVDADGRAQLGPKTAESEQLAAEQALEEKLLSTLEPVTGAGNVRASVNIDYDPAAVEETAENYDPSQTVTLSMQQTEQTSGPQQVPAGVPGTASNAPNSQAAPVYPQQFSLPSSSKSEASTYGASKRTVHSVQGAGRVRRMTAAILVNDKMASAPSPGKPAVWQPRSAEDLKHLTALAEAAVGYDPARGDKVTVEDISFDDNGRQTAPGWFKRTLAELESVPNLLRYLSMLLAVLLVILLALRPAIARMAGNGAASARALPKPGAASAAAALLKEQQEAGPIELTPEELERMRVQKVFDQVTEHLKREPNQSSRLLQSWIHSD